MVSQTLIFLIPVKKIEEIHGQFLKFHTLEIRHIIGAPQKHFASGSLVKFVKGQCGASLEVHLSSTWTPQVVLASGSLVKFVKR